MKITIELPADERLRSVWGANRELGREATRAELERWLADVALNAIVDEFLRERGFRRVSHLVEAHRVVKAAV